MRRRRRTHFQSGGERILWSRRFKFEFHRRPGDRHIHFFGADARSASETACGWKMAT
jgi:hypothetical protein